MPAPLPGLQAVELEAPIHACGSDELGVVAKGHSRGQATVLWGRKTIHGHNSEWICPIPTPAASVIPTIPHL